MAPTCYRCGRAAASWMAIDYQNRRVWLWDIGITAQEGVFSAVCRHHADRLVPPIKWTLFDRRNVTEMFQSSKETGVA
ncbi:MAG: hypothetical protein OXS33_03210 [bacterium]|nr:hypothetical protein [bacterium]